MSVTHGKSILPVTAWQKQTGCRGGIDSDARSSLVRKRSEFADRSAVVSGGEPLQREGINVLADESY